MGRGGSGMLLLCIGAVVVQYLFYLSIVSSHQRLDREIAAALQHRDFEFVSRVDHSQHSHQHQEEKKSIQDIQGIVERLASQVKQEEEEERAFAEKLRSIIDGVLPGATSVPNTVATPSVPLEIAMRPDRTSCEPEHPTTVFYNRIGKAGSTTLNEWIKKQCRESGALTVFGTDPESLDNSPSREEREIQRVVRQDRLNVHISHIYYLDFEKFGEHPSLSYINMMRHPGKRYISQYHFWRSLADTFGKECVELGVTLGECIERSHTEVVYTCPMANYQTLYLCGHGPDCVAPATEATFQLAKKHLMENYSSVGVLEEIDLYTKVLLKKFPDHFQSPYVDIGHSMKTGVKGSNDDAYLEMATELNNYDVQLYEIALDLFHQQAAQCGLM